MAYTKYSLTPANNTAAPPDGAPEGMLPSAVNDTMRDMMAQIRDVGDGIRDGTYTMTAPKITGGTITGSTINNSAIGGTTAAAGKFTTLEATGATTFSGATVANTFFSSGATITGGTINSTAIGGTTAAAGKFTTLEATGVATFSAGTVSAPAITTTGDTNTGIFFPAADTIAFTEGGVESMRIDSSGNVGIGTSSPVAGRALTLNSSSNYFGLVLQTSGTTRGQIIQESTGNIYFDVGSDGGSGALIIRTTAGIERMRIDSSGAVGIGTSTPSSYAFGLAIDNTNATNTGYIINLLSGGSSWFKVGRLAASSTAIIQSGQDLSLQPDSGNVLVGITSARANAGDVQVSKGISFPATQSAQSDANTLDDYEEGTWTPTISSATGTITTSSFSGAKYTKIGNVVEATVNITITTVGTAGGACTFTLPFTGTNTVQLGGYGMETNTNGSMLKGYLPSSSATMQITSYSNASPFSFGAGSNFAMNVVYQV